MTTTTQPSTTPPSTPPPPPDPPASGGQPASSGRPKRTGSGDIVRVTAFDGLFLRAEHLNRMQEYALQLNTALGVSLGSGTVHGFGLSVQGKTLTVLPGLAISQSGQILQSVAPVEVDLTNRAITGDSFFWIVVRPSPWNFGEEPVQGELCDVPCKPGTTRTGSQDQGVEVDLEPAQIPGLQAQGTLAKQNWLASRVFEREEAEQLRWPGVPDNRLPHDWWDPPPISEQLDDSVRIGVLIPDTTDRWQLDAWAARRDRGDPPQTRAWQWRLGMRPWDVFIAQILQFQAQLGARTKSGAFGGVAFMSALLNRIGTVRDSLSRTGQITKQAAADDLNELGQDIEKGRVGTQGPDDRAASLTSIGINELPPAGFLNVTQTGDGVGEEITRLLGGAAAVEVRVCRGDLRDVGGFVQRAQHRARIPLTSGVRQPIDILVPRPSGNDQLDWVAFARRDMIDCAADVKPTPEPDEPMAIYFLEQQREKALYQQYLDYLLTPKGTPPDLPRAPEAVFRYPVRTWALPDAPEYPRLAERMQDMPTGRTGMSVVAVVSENARRPLGAVRAGLFAAKVIEAGPVPLDLRTMVRHGDEAVVVLIPAGN